jgi:hypothetical protein
MAEMTAQREIQIPDGGIAGFMMSDEDFAELARQESERSFGNKGLAGFGDTATKMAALGRYGDDSIVHAQTGEIVVPKPVLDSNPELKQAIFDDMRARGIEDPERYVVGSETNSINPETGLMEFGFFSKVWSGVKKAASQTVKVLKKVAPIVLPIAMTIAFPALGAYGAALGSGIGTLLQGGDIKDALKSAAIAGLSAGAFKGFESMGSGGTFSEGFASQFSNPGARFAQVGQQLKSGFSGQGFNFGQRFIEPQVTAQDSGVFGESINKGDAASSYQTDAVTPSQQAQTDISGSTSTNQPKSLAEAARMEGTLGDSTTTSGPTARDVTFTQDNYINAGPSGSEQVVFKEPTTEKSFLQKTKDVLFPGEYSAADVGKSQAKAYQEAYDASMAVNGNTQIAHNAGMTAMSRVPTGPSFIQKYGPLTATAGLAAYGMGAFDEPEPEPSPLGLQSGPTAEEIIASNPNKYLMTMESLTAQAPTYFSPFTQYASSSSPVNTLPAPFTTVASRAPAGPFSRTTTLPQVAMRPVEMPDSQPTTLPYPYKPGLPPGYKPTVPPLPGPNYPYPTVYVKDGGAIYPRRNGGIMPDEGVPGKDSVRAMLMPGEFVMTTDAVRGAGDGDLNRGINNMYNVMANLERKGRMS